MSEKFPRLADGTEAPKSNPLEENQKQTRDRARQALRDKVEINVDKFQFGAQLTANTLGRATNGLAQATWQGLRGLFANKPYKHAA